MSSLQLGILLVIIGIAIGITLNSVVGILTVLAGLAFIIIPYVNAPPR